MRINHQIRLLLLATSVFAIASCVGAGSVRAQSDRPLKFPYQAFVLHDETAVHSGPGQVHYATERLRQGAVVEVYREDPGGWCAIRPVEGSFSLVPEATVELLEKGVGRILESGTQAWVGTKLGPVDQPLWQIKLKKGELVEVLGQVSWPSPEGHSTIWYQIAPPAGEFRWVQMSDIQLPASVAASRPDQPEMDQPGLPSKPSQVVRSLNEVIPEAPPIDVNTKFIEEYALRNKAQNTVQQAALQIQQPEVRPYTATDSLVINRGWRQATGPIGTAADDGSFDRAFGSGMASDRTSSNVSPEISRDAIAIEGQLRFSDSSPNEIMRFASADTLAPELARNLNLVRNQNGFAGSRETQNALPSIGQPSRNLSDLELQLTREMIKENPSDWQLEDLEMAAQGIYRTSQNPNERSLAQRYLTKVANCKAIRAGFRSNLETVSSTFTRRSTQPIGTGINPDFELGTTYDAHGWLTELVRDGGSSQTEYALQDANGKITHHISPAPGMNLRRYLKSYVGVIGQRGYHSQLKLDHVTAHRIVELEQPR